MSDTTPEAAFADALSTFQAGLPAVGKDNSATVKSEKGSYKYSYADLTAVTEAALPLLANCGLSWTSRPTMTEHGFVLRYSLLHVGGHREDGDFPLPDPARFSSQQIGSAITYARRYSLCAVTGIAPGGDDDDGEKAAGAVSDIAVRDRGRTPGKTTRTQPDGPQDDEWTTPPLRITDPEWIDNFRQRITACTTPGEVRGLWAEAVQKYADQQLTDDDSKALEAEMRQRTAEIKGEVVSA